MLGLKAALRESGIAKQTPDQRAMIDAVLFALWAQGHRERSVAASVGMILAGGIGRAFVELLYLPTALPRRMPEIVLAGIFAGLVVYAFEGIRPLNAAALFLLALLILLKDQALRFVREILFDIGDVLSLGALTLRYINRHFMLGPLIIHDDRDGLKEHLFVSRILTSGPYLAETEAFQELVSRQPGNWSEVQSQIEEYWRKYLVEPGYWQGIRDRKFGNE
jgi:hypothetical protein